ncbi:hypothetical protein LC848_RS27080, partial [Escherichia coli]
PLLKVNVFIFISCPFGLKKERSLSPFDETIIHLFRCIDKASALKNGKLFDDCHTFYPRQRM